MEEVITSKSNAMTNFYEFNQNNSGGYFDVDENVCHRVIIEAKDQNMLKKYLNQ